MKLTTFSKWMLTQQKGLYWTKWAAHKVGSTLSKIGVIPGQIYDEAMLYRWRHHFAEQLAKKDRAKALVDAWVGASKKAPNWLTKNNPRFEAAKDSCLCLLVSLQEDEYQTFAKAFKEVDSLSGILIVSKALTLAFDINRQLAQGRASNAHLYGVAHMEHETVAKAEIRLYGLIEHIMPALASAFTNMMIKRQLQIEEVDGELAWLMQTGAEGLTTQADSTSKEDRRQMIKILMHLSTELVSKGFKDPEPGQAQDPLQERVKNKLTLHLMQCSDSYLKALKAYQKEVQKFGTMSLGLSLNASPEIELYHSIESLLESRAIKACVKDTPEHLLKATPSSRLIRL